MAPTYHIGQRLSYDSHLCTVRYIGEVTGTQKEWLGVEWDDPTRGKHDGEHLGVRYFSCRSRSKKAASFVRPTRVPDPVRSFVEAVHQKYASEIIERREALVPESQIQISASKVVEEVGFEKIRLQLAQLHELKIVIVDGLQIASAEKDGKTIKETCPKIQELDLSRNLFETPEEIIRICIELENLKILRLNGNRLQVLSQHSLSSISRDAFAKLKELSLDEMLVNWKEACLLVNDFPALTALSASSNELTSLHTQIALTPPISTWNLKSLTLDYNLFSSLVELSPLTAIQSLEKLHLKGNKIQVLGDENRSKPLFGNQLYYVDLSYNDIANWTFIDELSDVFPGLTALRFSHNPIYESAVKEGNPASSIEEGYMLTLARIANLKVLNFSNITPADRTNAEMFYLSRIGKALATVPESEAQTITAQHRRFPELCAAYGPPAVVRGGSAINPDFLEARLIKFTFYIPPVPPSQNTDEHTSETPPLTKIQEIPRGFDVYQVKGIVGRLFGRRPLALRLVWETGEWDPVAGYEDEDEDADDEDEDGDDSDGDGNYEDEAGQWDPIEEASEEAPQPSTGQGRGAARQGKWMRREVELENGTRQIGFWIDGREARVRVESLS